MTETIQQGRDSWFLLSIVLTQIYLNLVPLYYRSTEKFIGLSTDVLLVFLRYKRAIKASASHLNALRSLSFNQRDYFACTLDDLRETRRSVKITKIYKVSEFFWVTLMQTQQQREMTKFCVLYGNRKQKNMSNFWPSVLCRTRRFCMHELASGE